MNTEIRNHAFSPEHALARYAVMGTFNGAYYASDEDQLARVEELARAVSPEIVAQAAIYCREHGRMKDVPAFLVAHLATVDVGLMIRVFPKVIDDARMLRAFVSIVRSGVTGRKSFGSAPKRALRAWFAARSPEQLFRQSIGQSPSMSDVIKMVRPPPRNDKGEADAVREALYGYLIGKNVDRARLPPLANAYEAFKAGEGPLPDVPFEMLIALPLRREHWTELAKRMTFNQLRQNLNTLFRHGVLADATMVETVAERLSDPEAIRLARTMPYQLLAAHRAVDERLPNAIAIALGRAVEHAVANVPRFSGTVALCPDVSGSMHAPVAGRRSRATNNVRCVDVAALVTAALQRRADGARVLPFSNDTTCAAPLRSLNERELAPDLVVFVSDNQSWTDFRGPEMAEEWERLSRRSPGAKLVLVDVQPSPTPLPDYRDDVLHVGGFSDAVFDVVASFGQSRAGGGGALDAIRAVPI